MQLNKIHVSEQADNALRHLKARTSLTPNLLCRVGLCLSLSDPSIPNPEDFDEAGREFNRYTLTGEWDSLFVALMLQRLYQDQMPSEEAERQFVAHVNRGVLYLFQRVKNLRDLSRLVEGTRIQET